EAPPPASTGEDEHLGLFSLDDIPLREDAEAAGHTAAQQPPAPPAQPPAVEEIESLQEAIDAGQVQPFSLADLGLSEEEIAALGLGPSAESDEDISSELGITEEELEGLNLEDPNWSQLPSAAQPSAPAAEPPTAGELEPQRISGDLVVDRLIALG